MQKLNFSLLRNISKNFTSTATPKLKIKSIKENSNNLKIEYKPFYFKYQNIEFKADLPASVDQSLKEFLDYFGKDRSLFTKTKLNCKNFEAYKGGKYLPLNFLLNSLNTHTNDSNALTILDEKLTLNNIRFRNLNHLRNPYESASQSLQTYLNGFLENVNLVENDWGADSIKSLLKSLGDARGNNPKLIIMVGSFLDKIKNASKDFKPSIQIRNNFHLSMQEFNKTDKENLFLIENSQNGIKIPVNIVNYKSEEEKTLKFSENIIDNLDTLRKISTKFNTTSNFGFVTDFYSWKINYYRKPDNNSVEDPFNYLTSLKYNLSISSEYVNENIYSILLKVLTGIINADPEKLNKENFA